MRIFKGHRDESEGTLKSTWQERSLQRILVITAVAGFFALIPAVISNSDIILRSVYIGVFALLVMVIVIRLPYSIKATTFVAFPLILGFSHLIETGIRGDFLFFFLSFLTLAALFLGPRAAIATLIMSELIIIGMGYLVLNEQFALLDKLAPEGDWIDLIGTAASYLLFSTIILIALQMLNKKIQQYQQKAIAIQHAQRESQNDIENRVEEQTLDLSRKMDLLNATSIVTHQTATLQDLGQLLNRTVDLISKYFACYHVGIYLINQRGDYVALQAATSDGGKNLLEQGFRIRVGTEGIIGYVAAEKKPRLSLDVGKDVIFFDKPELNETRSELSLPLLIDNKLVGVLDLQSKDYNAFRFDEIEIFQNMADQIAAAIERALLISESQHVISQLEAISSENTRQNWKTEISLQRPAFRYTITGVHPIRINGSEDKKVGNVLDIPLILRGQKIGNISLKRKSEFQKWTTQEESIARDVATQAALALENIRLVERTKERANREQMISKVSSRIRESLDLDIVLRTSAREIQKALSLEEAEIRLIPPNNLDNDER